MGLGGRALAFCSRREASGLHTWIRTNQSQNLAGQHSAPKMEPANGMLGLHGLKSAAQSWWFNLGPCPSSQNLNDNSSLRDMTAGKDHGTEARAPASATSGLRIDKVTMPVSSPQMASQIRSPEQRNPACTSPCSRQGELKQLCVEWF